MVRRLVLPALLLLVGLPAATAIAAEAPRTGRRAVPRKVGVDFGAYADDTTWTYVVRRGDTLSQIAEAQLGTLRRQGEITALNPGLDAKTLRADAAIRMPPRRAPTEAGPARAWWDLYAAPAGGGGPLERVSSGDALPRHRGGTWLYAVRHAHARAFERAVRTHGGVPREVRGSPWFAAVAQPLAGSVSLAATTPVASLVDHLRIVALGPGRLALARTARERYDAHHRRLDETAWMRHPLNLLLLTLGFGALLGLVILVSRWGRTPGLSLSLRA